MKIDYVSDVHADFWVNFVPNQQKWETRTKEFAKSLIPTKKGELLIVAGDFSNLNRQSKWLFEVWSQEYEQIFVVFGNHDYYLDSKSMMKKYKSSVNRINEMKTYFDEVANITVLERFQVVEHKGVRFAGDTAWYPVKSQKEQNYFNQVTNDSKLIRGFYIPDAYDVHQEAYGLLKEADVIVTHVPPIHGCT
jgi:predicted phosphodiesterase